MQKRYILAVDQGTSGSKAVLFDRAGRIRGRCGVASRQFYPQPGWVEQDAEEIYAGVLEAIRRVIQETGADPGEVASIAISNQRETVVVWEKATGRPVCNAVIWNCGRAAETCRELDRGGFAETVRAKTGLVLSPYFSAAKLKWILDHTEGARQKAQRGELLFGTVDSWLVYRLTGGTVHATEPSNASRTQLFNIHTLAWDPDLLAAFTIPTVMAPAVRASNAVFGETDAGIFPSPVPITGVLGDSSAALFGQCCFRPGMAKATYGTGSSVMMNLGKTCALSENGLVTSVAWGLSGGVEYAFEGNVNFSAAVVKWLTDDLQLISDARECAALAASVPDNGGVYLVPAFTGLGAPYWNDETRALITGLSRGSKKAHVVRAAEESIAYQIRDIVDLMEKDAGMNLSELRVDGGASGDDFLMQFQADILAKTVARSKIGELSAAGAAYLSGLTVGFWSGKEELEGLRIAGMSFSPRMEPGERERLYAGWKSAVRRVLFDAK